VIVDAGPLIAADRNRRAFAALVRAAEEHGEILRTTEAIVAQVWRSHRQENLAAALSALEIVDSFGSGRRVGELLAQSGTNDPIDAHIVLLARATNETVLTSDPDDIEKLAALSGVRTVKWEYYALDH